jgi:asparagine synthetase B (glutamine-hydrolysing)
MVSSILWECRFIFKHYILLSPLVPGNDIIRPMFRKNYLNLSSRFSPQNRLACVFRKVAARAYTMQRRAGSGAPFLVLATGGLDSSLLASLLRPCEPRLFFARVLDRTTREYNVWSIRRCRFLARALGLRFLSLPITQADYRRAYVSLRCRIPLLSRDKDIAAVDVFFRSIAMRCQGPGIVVSGMGMNELCDLSADGISSYYRTKAAVELRVHRRLARAYGLFFWAPWLDADVVRLFSSLSLASRKNKKLLKEIIAASRLLPPSFLTQPSRHSTIPVSFYRGLD